MTNFLIIDSNKNFAEKLSTALGGGSIVEGKNFFNSASFSNLGEETTKIVKKLNDETIILINAEGKTSLGYLQEQILVELGFWLRCKHERKNAIVFYSIQSIDQLLKQKPENFILHSPGCYHLQLPFFTKDLERIKSYTPLKPNEDIKPYIKARINLDLTRHRYANYAGMALMLLTAKEVYDCDHINRILGKQSGNNPKFNEFYGFWDSLNYCLLAYYYNLETSFNIRQSEKNRLKQTNDKGILLIDDFAEKGWKPIISQIIYGNNDDSNLKCLQIEYTAGKLDIDKTNENLKKHIEDYLPHLVLLDLRLNNDEGKADVKILGGYKILEFIKKKYKGLPVIMFTASNKAETTKQLLDAGADAVWTKPGIDEGLSNNEILERYKKLTTLVGSVFEPDYMLLTQINDNPERRFNVKAVNFDSIRNLLFRKLDFIRYRLQLYSDTEIKNLIVDPYKSADAIYVDSNSLITGDQSRNYSDLISSVVTVALLTSRANCNFIFEPFILPKVVIMNTVFDEVVKLAKVERIEFTKGRWNLCCKRASITQLVMKELFDDDKVRTELSSSKKSNLKDPKENTYADGYILDEIASLIVTHKSAKFNYKVNTKVVCVTGDNGLRDKLKCFDPTESNLILRTREEFIEEISNIKF